MSTSSFSVSAMPSGVLLRSPLGESDGGQGHEVTSNRSEVRFQRARTDEFQDLSDKFRQQQARDI